MASSWVTPGLSSFYWHLVPPLSLPPWAPGSSFPLFSKSCRILGDFSDPMDSYQTPCPHSFLTFPNRVTSILFVLWPLSLRLYPKPHHHSELLPFCSWSCDDYCGGTMRCLNLPLPNCVLEQSSQILMTYSNNLGILLKGSLWLSRSGTRPKILHF